MPSNRKSPFSHHHSSSPTAQKAASNWVRKTHDMAVAGIGFGMLGRGYDVKLHDKKEFNEKYARLNSLR